MLRPDSLSPSVRRREAGAVVVKARFMRLNIYLCISAHDITCSDSIYVYIVHIICVYVLVHTYTYVRCGSSEIDVYIRSHATMHMRLCVYTSAPDEIIGLIFPFFNV